MNAERLPSKESWPYVARASAFFQSVVGYGTATLIHPRLLLTAGHVVYDRGAGGYPRWIDLELGGANRVRRRVLPSTFRTTQQWQDEDSKIENPVSAFDVGAILLDPGDRIDPQTEASWVRYDQTADEDLHRLQYNVVGYCGVSNCLGELYGGSSAAADPDASANGWRVFYDVRTVGGMSGGPVYTVEADNRVRVRGVHTSLYKGFGSALRITPAIAGLLNGWLNEANTT
jgi:V8-like Glu-specific endopeptidase